LSCESKAVLKVANERLISISQDERERAIFSSRRISESDMASNLAAAEDRGERCGIEIGRMEGVQNAAKNMLMEGEPITRAAGLGENDVTILKDQILY